MPKIIKILKITPFFGIAFALTFMCIRSGWQSYTVFNCAVILINALALESWLWADTGTGGNTQQYLRINNVLIQQNNIQMVEYLSEKLLIHLYDGDDVIVSNASQAEFDRVASVIKGGE
jgi:hypothetical protein